MAPTLIQTAALALRASSLVCPTAPTCPQDDQCTYVSNGVSLQVSCATDFFGGDLQSIRTSTLAECLSSCATTDGCVAISYVNENCYMKNTINAAQANDNVIGASVLSRNTATVTPSSDASTCPASFTCPENDGCTIQSADSRTFTLSCGVDYYGGDLTNMYASSLDVCTQACVDNTQCIAASYVISSGQCYLKDTNKGGRTDGNVNGIAIKTEAVPSTSTSTTSTSSDIISSTSTEAAASPSTASSSSSIVSSSSSIASSSTSSNIISSTSSPSVPTSSVLSSSSAVASSSVHTESSSTSPAASSSSSIVSSSFSSTSTPKPTPSSSSVPSSTPTPTPTPASTPKSTLTPTSTSTSTPKATPTQALLNTGFEDGTGSSATGWTLGGIGYLSSSTGRLNTSPRNGGYSFQAQGAFLTTWSFTLRQTVTVSPGQAYNLSLWGKQGAVGNCYLTVSYNGVVLGLPFSPSTTYSKSVWTVPSELTYSKTGSVFFSGVCAFGLSTKKFWLDDVTMTPA